MAKQFSIQDAKPWKSRFFTIWGGQALSILGSQLVQFALIWYITIESGSAVALATASLVGMLPNVILGPFVGTLVDRLNRRKIMMAADGVVALATLILAGLFVLDLAAVWHIYIIMFIRSLAGCFHTNAMSATTSLLVPVENLTRIQGLNQMLDGGLNIISAPLGAILLAALPLQGILAIDILTAIIAIIPLFFLSIPEPERRKGDHGWEVNQTTVWEDLKSGFRYIRSWPGLMIIGLMTVMINFTIIPAFSLLPLLVKDFFGGSAIQLGWVQSAMGVGMLLGGALLGVWGGFKKRILTSMMGLMGMGIGTLIIAGSPSWSLYAAVGGSLFVGLMTPITMGPFYAVIQSTAEPDMQARVFSMLSSVGTAMVPLGLMIAGPISDLVGIPMWFYFGGLLTIVMGIVGLFIPAVMNIENRQTEKIPITSPSIE